MTRTWLTVGLLFWVGISLLAGQVGNLLGEPGESEFYERLDQPAWAPPSAVFGPVWIVLYVLMGIAAWLVWREHGLRGASFTLGLFLVHLVFNAAWTGIFFGLQRFGLAVAEILVLWALIAWLLVRFWRVRPLAGALLAPYLLWVTYAAALTFALWRMNPEY